MKGRGNGIFKRKRERVQVKELKGDGTGGWGDVLGLWDGNPEKSDCYDHYITTDVINSFE